MELTDLLKSARATAAKPKAKATGTLDQPLTIRWRPTNLPEAIVLAMIRTKCQCCGTIIEYPSMHLLERFPGNNYVWTTLTVDRAPPGLPFEIRYTDTENAHCPRCFPTPERIIQNPVRHTLAGPTTDGEGTHNASVRLGIAGASR